MLDRSSRETKGPYTGNCGHAHSLEPQFILFLFLPTRIAFAKNKIKDLPSNFATLTRLRYLNLRMNALSQFPPVVCIRLYFYIPTERHPVEHHAMA